MTSKVKKFRPRVFAALILSGVIALWLTGAVWAAPKALPVKVAVIDLNILFQKHPGTQEAVASLIAERERLKAEYDEKSKNLSQEDKRKLSGDINARAAAKEAELLGPVWRDLDKAIDLVMEEGGYTLIVKKDTVIRGGTDITEEAAKKLGQS
ncbi:MAG: OmpH family outer membrane protein [Acidaminococcales bacterium]|jgi:outer membrane protein|nr:OmpH family outer membrane protein [Acidaminococcales bacterium]